MSFVLIRKHFKREICSLRQYTGGRSDPFRVCIIGSGPSGFYTAFRLLKKSDDIHIDMVEAKREPFGLIRFGVAPDHPEVKNCTAKFEELVVENSSRFAWFGGVSLGKDVTLNELSKNYDAVVLAIGAQFEKKLNVLGDSLVTSSRTFTHWMNGSSCGPILKFDPKIGAPNCHRCALVIGNGNVALDTARSLVGNPMRFSGTSIGASAMNELKSSTLRHVAIIGRRGPLHSSFAAKELREIFKLCRIENIKIFTNINPNDEGTPLTRTHTLLMDELSESTMLENLSTSWPPQSERSLSMFFYLSPIKFLGSKNHDGINHLVGTELRKNILSPDGSIFHEENAASHEKSQHLVLPSALVVTCLGYGVGAIPGAEEAARKYPNGPLVNERGFINDSGLFVSGWTKTGPAGALASTMLDAYETADSILEKKEYLLSKRESKNPNPMWLKSMLLQRNISWLTFNNRKTSSASTI